ncbi:putative acetyltransferase [Erwinia phage Wellington]|uniref:Putative acetyltransferase n=2 Tax=Wellingtonvirus wellington TaxID=2734153 RepID=A0A345BLL9_9CAUD|nr:putative acetyltransferase [Erwinia phage Wellington]AXF51340.1 putative acetyltransferase [Erwinia phage Wellington]
MGVEYVTDEQALAQADHNTLLAMYQHFLEEHGRMVQGTDVVKPSVHALLDNDMCLVTARWKGGLIGFVTFGITETRNIALHVVYTLRERRRRGVASALLDEIRRQHPEKRMVAEVYQRNQPALRLFTKHYFTFVFCTGWASAVREIGNPYP